MKNFKKYIDQVETIARGIEINTMPERNIFAEAILNGEVSRKFRDTVPLNIRREYGVFFTSENLAKIVTRKLLLDFNEDTLIVDPACGTGDLLLACANKMPVGKNLRETLNIWSKHLSGFDIFPEFIKATKARLVLLAKLKTNRFDSNITNIDSYFPFIRVQDLLKDTTGIERASHIILNPPYNKISAPNSYNWANKKVSAASIFMDICISKASANTKIRAILPDVLRTGSSYRKWREHIASSIKKSNITIYGQFDKWTDVDVFIFKLYRANYKKRAKTTWWRSLERTHKGKVGDYFKVHVGPVVPHRHEEKGPSVAYIHAKILPAWGEVTRINERRKFSGTLFEPPFVAIRRTSRPGDKRAIATIIKGKRKVAVENHIIALFPNRSTINECKELINVLKSRESDRWLDKRIRCRHLTVPAIKEIPWWRS